MAYTTIDKPSKYFLPVIYTGTGANQTITVGFQPDLVWTKSRSSTYSHEIQDAIRGVTKVNYTDNFNAETTTSTNIQSFNSTGYVQGSGTGVNGNGATFVSWNWLGANTTVSNTNGSVTSTVSSNTTSGFSIATYTGTGANFTVGHGLGIAPSMIIVKSRANGGDNWYCYHKSLGATKYIFLDLDADVQTYQIWNNTSPTSSVFSHGVWSGNNSSANLMAYCFAELKGYSKFVSYTGNGSNDGTFVYTGFKPALTLIRMAGVSNWVIQDSTRETYNDGNRNGLFPDTNDVEAVDANPLDYLSNGFKPRAAGTGVNGSGSTYVYMCFAENPFVSSKGIPCTAR